MPILPTVGRRSPKLRLVIFCLYTVLCIGGLSMIYPFSIMLATSVSSNFDNDVYSPVPFYLFDDGVLFAKYIHEKDEMATLGWEYGVLGLDGDEGQAWSIRQDISAPEPLASWLRGEEGGPTLEQARGIVADFDEFRLSMPDYWTYTYFHRGNHLVIDTYTMWQEWIAERFSIEELREQWGETVDEMALVVPGAEDPWRHGFWRSTEPKEDWWIRYKTEELPARFIKPLSINYVWFYYLRVQPIEPGSEDLITSAAAYNAVFGTDCEKITDARFPREEPERGYARQLWHTFVRSWLPASMVRLTADAELYREFLVGRYPTIELYNEVHGRSIESFDDVEPTYYPPEDRAERHDWQEFIGAVDGSRFVSYLQDRYGTVEAYNAAHEAQITAWDQVPVGAEPPKPEDQRADWEGFMAEAGEAAFVSPTSAIVIDAPEWAYQRQLSEKYGSLEALNAAYGGGYSSLEEIEFPIPLADAVGFLDNRGAIRRLFLTSNYGKVVEFLVLQGRAVRNTIVYVLATVLVQLTVNPMAAYALSRFRLRQANKILIFLLATMAFPGEVTMIPQFLMLKQFHMLNTYWALILPGLANGFSIFLLKGFFDSLPAELYEAAIMDGASEMRMFSTVTLPLSKPVLAVIALGAFTFSYGQFMYAFLVCQDRSMWTIMVFIYEFQQHQGAHVVMASLVLASIPTLLVFMAAQKVILRGIVIPSFK